jgi:glycosyltransferase involved in cell wall biosynthesis
MLITKKSPLISTVVLNWNRADLLFHTLDSYLKTISVPYEMFIIDNASSDNSKSVINEFCQNNPDASAIFLPKNLGGEAINIGLEKAQGQFFHISENDLEYLPNWADKCIDLFEHFPSLGQLSLFGPLPADDLLGGVGAIPASQLRHSQGRIIYELKENSGTSCVMRREIYKQGIRVHSLPEREGFIFPNDGRLSLEIKEAGYMVARSDHYIVKNIGHNVEEIKKRSEYYIKNYRAKPSIGEAKLKEKMAKWEKSAKPLARASFLFPEENILREKTLSTNKCSESNLWSMFDEWTPEIETLEFIYSMTRLFKPIFCVETGSWRGFLAEAIGHALQQNGRGKLISLEKDNDIYAVASERIAEQNLEAQVEIFLTNSLAFTTNEKIDLLILGSDVNLRLSEFWHFKPYFNDKAIIVFQDANHTQVDNGLKEVKNHSGMLSMLSFPTPRGLVLCQYNNNVTH